MFLPVPPRREPSRAEKPERKELAPRSAPEARAADPELPRPPAADESSPRDGLTGSQAGPNALTYPPLAEQPYSHGAQQLRAGVSPAEVEKSLIRCGLTPGEAAQVVADLRRTGSRVLQEAGRKNMKHGALWCAGGILVTLLTFQSGGTVVIAWGAIVFGGIQFFRGMNQLSS